MPSSTSVSPCNGPFLSHPTHITRDFELVLKVVPMPADCNANGDIFGGWVMSQTDIAGALGAYRVARSRLVTVAVNEFIFKQPVRVGDVLSFFAKVQKVGRTSITIQVEVYAERTVDQGHFVKVTKANMTYVSIDAEGKPQPIVQQG